MTNTPQTVVELFSFISSPLKYNALTIIIFTGLHYNALSFIFLQVRELSWLQWHPFSVSSSPLDGKHHLSILIKVLGEWTSKLRDLITTVPEQPQTDLQSKLKHISASVEGLYGHEVPYHLM